MPNKYSITSEQAVNIIHNGFSNTLFSSSVLTILSKMAHAAIFDLTIQLVSLDISFRQAFDSIRNKENNCMMILVENKEK